MTRSTSQHQHKLSGSQSTPGTKLESRRSLYEQLPGIEIDSRGQVKLSSNMYVECPLVKVGVQIGNIRALPVNFFIVDDGYAPLLLGSDFLIELFNIQSSPSSSPLKSGSVSLDPPDKYDSTSVGIRLIPTGNNVDALQLERFLKATRTIHNVGVLANSEIHQHSDWPADKRVKRRAIRQTIDTDRSLHSENTLRISWVDNGSIWLSFKSGAKSALSWISQVFEKSTDARLRATIANAASAEEIAAIKQLTREDIARAKAWELQKITAQKIRETHDEWRDNTLHEIDFRAVLIEEIQDPEVREEAQRSLDEALSNIIQSGFMPIVENLPQIPSKDRDLLLIKSRPNWREPTF